MRRAVFLDRDGLVNRPVPRPGNPYPSARFSDLRLLPGVREACGKLREAGFALILITNQPGIARGLISAPEVAEMNRRLQIYLHLDGVGLCPHDESARCSCRKPQPGLLLEAARVWNIDLESSYIVGDHWRDIEAGHRAGCRTIFVDCGIAEQRPDGPFVRVRSLREASQWILRTSLMSVQMGTRRSA